MKKLRNDPTRDNRIHQEIIVDAYGPEEQAMGWYYYLENNLRFPFHARCIVTNLVSPLRRGEVVEAFKMAPEVTCSVEMMVMIRWQDRKMAVPLSQLIATDSDEGTVEAIADWHYWIDRGYTF
jgi:Calcium binding